MAATMTGASVPLVFDDGTEYMLAPLTDKDYDELEAWVQSEVLRIARDSIPYNAPRSERDRIEKMALEVALGTSWLFGCGASAFYTLAGRARLCWQSLRRDQPTVTVEQLKTPLKRLENIKRFNAAFDGVNSYPDTNKKEDGGGGGRDVDPPG